MLLCDVGNTSYHFYDLENDFKEDVKSFDPSTIEDEVYFICVHPTLKKRLRALPNWEDLEEKIDKTPFYDTMGIDRIVACHAITDGVIVDAGSAITVDVLKGGVFQGGFIYPGLKAFQNSYATISKALRYDFNTQVDTTKLPKNTQDAISYGFFAPLLKEIRSYDMETILTGGDAAILHRYLPDAKVDRHLLFRGMLFVLGRELC